MIMAMATWMRVSGQRKVAMRKVAAMERLLHIPFTANAESAVTGNMVAISAVGHTGNTSEHVFTENVMAIRAVGHTGNTSEHGDQGCGTHRQHE